VDTLNLSDWQYPHTVDAATLSAPTGRVLAVIPDEDGAPWLVVDDHYPPSAFLGDDGSRQAEYETNLEAAAGSFADGLDWQEWSSRSYRVVPDTPANRETLERLTARLADYPLLDESAYSEREYDAWQECWTDWAGAEVASAVGAELVECGAVEWAAEMVAQIDDATFSTWAHDGMGYFYGFSGEYDEAGAVGAVLDGIAGFIMALDLLAYVGPILSGHVPLPLPRF
jgi:hypothetical protein